MARPQFHNYDYLIKLLVIGDSGIGKTCLLLRFADDTFTTSHLPTIGVDFKIKTIEVDRKQVKLQIWDTAGQERYKTITQTYYKGAMGIIIAYDCTDEDSFNNVMMWLEQVRNHADEDVKKVLIANKCDRPDRKVSTEQGQALAQQLGLHFLETSSKSNINVQETFQYIAKTVKDSKATPQTDATGLRLGQQRKKEGCC